MPLRHFANGAFDAATIQRLPTSSNHASQFVARKPRCARHGAKNHWPPEMQMMQWQRSNIPGPGGGVIFPGNVT